MLLLVVSVLGEGLLGKIWTMWWGRYWVLALYMVTSILRRLWLLYMILRTDRVVYRYLYLVRYAFVWVDSPLKSELGS